MKDILSSFDNCVLLGNGLTSWMCSLGIVIASYLVLKLAFRIAENQIYVLSAKTTAFVDNIIVAVLRSTRGWFQVILALWIGSRILDRSGYNGLIDLSLLLAATLQVALWANRAVTAYIEYFSAAQREENPGSISAVQGLSFIVRLTIWSVAILFTVDNLTNVPLDLDLPL